MDILLQVSRGWIKAPPCLDLYWTSWFMALTSHQTRAPEAELAPTASSTTDKPISHLHYTEGICGGAARGRWERWSVHATFRTNGGSEERPDRFTQLPQTKRRRGPRQQRRGLHDFCADCKPVCYFCWISHLLFFLTPPCGNKVSFVSSRLQPPPPRLFLYCSYMLNRSEDATFCRSIHNR